MSFKGVNSPKKPKPSKLYASGHLWVLFKGVIRVSGRRGLRVSKGSQFVAVQEALRRLNPARQASQGSGLRV